MAKNPTPASWAAALLQRLGIPQSPGAVQSLVGWERAEGGHWNNTARYNPLNTTQNAPGAGNTGTQGNIKVYRSWDQGLNATVQTLRNGHYGGILNALKAGNPNAVASAIGNSPWGTNGGLVSRVISGTPATSAQPFTTGGPNAPASSGQPSAPGGLTASDTSSGVDVSALLSALQTQKQAPPSMGLQAPSFSAAPALPSGYQALTSGGGPQPKPDIGSLLSLVRTQGTDATGAVSATGAPQTPSGAVGGVPAPGGVLGRARPGDPVVAKQQSVGGLHQTDGLPGYPAHDYFAPAGSPAVAPVTGKVIKLSGHDPKLGPVQGPHGPLGWSVYIQGSDGRTYFMTHMGSRNVKIGQTVKQGQQIGTVANYAKYGTPSHIHLGIRG